MRAVVSAVGCMPLLCRAAFTEKPQNAMSDPATEKYPQQGSANSEEAEYGEDRRFGFGSLPLRLVVINVAEDKARAYHQGKADVEAPQKEDAYQRGQYPMGDSPHVFFKLHYQRHNAANHPPRRPAEFDDMLRVRGRVHWLVRRRLNAMMTRSAPRSRPAAHAEN